MKTNFTKNTFEGDHSDFFIAIIWRLNNSRFAFFTLNFTFPFFTLHFLAFTFTKYQIQGDHSDCFWSTCSGFQFSRFAEERIGDLHC